MQGIDRPGRGCLHVKACFQAQQRGAKVGNVNQLDHGSSLRHCVDAGGHDDHEQQIVVANQEIQS